MSEWYRIVDRGQAGSDLFIAHIVPESLLEPVRADLLARGLGTHSITPTVDEAIDLPGMIWKHRQFCRFQLEGLTLRIPATDVSVLLSELGRLSVRSIGDGLSYYKLHAYMRCICLTPELYSVLLTGMRAVEPMAEQISVAEAKMQREAYGGTGPGVRKTRPPTLC